MSANFRDTMQCRASSPICLRMGLAAIVLLLVSSVGSIAGSRIVDPVADFLQHRSLQADDKLLKLVTDINQDGGQQVFVSLDRDTDSESGNIWVVYLRRSDHAFVRVDATDTGDTIEFRPDCFYVGKVDGVKGRVLAGYSHGGGGTGSLFAYQVSRNGIHVAQSREIRPLDKDKALFDKLFVESKPPAVEETAVQK